jgi:tetratricopeptide (TPR) repeat protein
MYEGLYGCSPFAPGSIAEVEESKRRGNVQPPPSDARIPSHFFGVLRRGLASRPEARWPSMDALIEQLQWDPRGARRWVVGMVGAAAAVSAIGTAAWWQLREPAGVCAHVDEQLSTTWNEGRDASLRAAFDGVGVPYAGDAYARARARIDAYARAWSRTATRTCEAMQTSGDGSDALLALREACLHSRLDHLDALLEAFAGADAAVVEHAVAATDRLPPLDSCHDDDRLAARARHASPRASAQAPALRRALVQAAIREWTGHAQQALDTASETAQLAKAAGDPEVEVEALLRRGSAQAQLGRPAEAEHDLSEALWSAAGLHHDEVAATAARRLVQVVGSQHGRAEDGHLWARHARASSGHAAMGDVARASLEVDVARILAQEGQLAQALVGLERAQQLLEPMDPKPVVRVQLAAVRGEMLQAQGRIDAACNALRDAKRLSIEIYGDDHPRTAEIQRILGDALHRSGRAQQAREAHEHALATLDAAKVDDARRVPSWLGLGEVHLSLDEADEAAASFGRALQELGDEGDKRRVADARFGLARALRDARRSGADAHEVQQRATRLAARARDTYAQLGDRDAVARVEAWLAARSAPG